MPADTPWVARLLDAADDPAAERAALEARQPQGRLVSRRGSRCHRLPRLTGRGLDNRHLAGGGRRDGRAAATAEELTMRRVASVIRLPPEKEAEYRALHAHAWPGVLGAAHVTNYSIFLRDGLLFSYLEYTGDDYDADMARVAADEATRRGGN